MLTFVRRVSSMSQMQKLLFLCGHNQHRSPTAVRLCREWGAYEAQSAGTQRGARAQVTLEQIEWADLIFVMEPDQFQVLRRRFGKALSGKQLICLQIPDKYGFMSPELIDLLKERLSLYVQIPD